MNEFWDKVDPGFFAPIWLGVGLVAVIAVVLLEIGARRRRQQALRLFAASHLIQALTVGISPAKQLLKRVLLVTAVALLFMALARPHLFYNWREESRTGLDVLMAVDCSKSMLTEDVKPNRLERAKLALADFAEKLPDNRLGLIAFAGDAFLQCPLTIDHEAFQTAVRELDTDTIPRPGTDIATAIEQANLALKSQPDNMKILILVTDGEDLEGRALDAARSAAKNGLKIYTVGVGTPEGGLIPQADEPGGFHHDGSGQFVKSTLDEGALGQIASITGGAYVPLGRRGEGLEDIYNRYIAPLPRQHLEERREKVRFERFEWPLSLAMILLMWEFLVTERAAGTDVVAVTSGPSKRQVRRRARNKTPAAATLLMLGLLLSGATGSVRAAATDTAERDYQKGNYEDALQYYRQAAESQPNRSDLQFNRGDAAYKAGEYKEAEESFRKTLETPDLGLQEKTYFNLGNTQFKHGDAMQKADKDKTIDLWEQALKSYESALKLKTTADARHNYEIVKEKLEELKKQQQQQQQQDQDKKDQSKSDNQNQSKNPKQDDQGKDQKDQQQQQDQKDSQNGQNPSQPKPSPGDQSKPQDQANGDKKDKDGQQPQPGASNAKSNAQQQAYSGTRAQDKQDPGVKSREEAEALLDSLKDDERHVTARSLNANNEAPPPPASGKDW